MCDPNMRNRLSQVLLRQMLNEMEKKESVKSPLVMMKQEKRWVVSRLCPEFFLGFLL